MHLDGYNFLPYLTGEERERLAVRRFYFNDDGDLAALRYKPMESGVHGAAQRGTMQIWVNRCNVAAPSLRRSVWTHTKRRYNIEYLL
ncbi:hypothetical protein O9929_23130 [Vibrio lentus]|nr:hypothetical protein [Vibrio lentus]